MKTIFILIIVGLIFAAGIAISLYKQKHRHSLQEGEPQDMIKQYYYYLVLFATLMMSIGGSVGVFMSAADYISPSSYYQSFADYSMMMEKQAPSDKANLTEEKLRQSYQEIVSLEKQRVKDNALNGIIKNLGFIIIPLPVFFYFQRQVRRKEHTS